MSSWLNANHYLIWLEFYAQIEKKNIKSPLERMLDRLIHPDFLILSMKSRNIMPPPTTAVLLIGYLAPESGKSNWLFLCLPEWIRLIWQLWFNSRMHNWKIKHLLDFITPDQLFSMLTALYLKCMLYLVFRHIIATSREACFSHIIMGMWVWIVLNISSSSLKDEVKRLAWLLPSPVFWFPSICMVESPNPSVCTSKYKTNWKEKGLSLLYLFDKCQPPHLNPSSQRESRLQHACVRECQTQLSNRDKCVQKDTIQGRHKVTSFQKCWLFLHKSRISSFPLLFPFYLPFPAPLLFPPLHLFLSLLLQSDTHTQYL